jgi:hypothetical protein
MYALRYNCTYFGHDESVILLDNTEYYASEVLSYGSIVCMIFSYDISHDEQPKGIVMYDDLKKYSIYYAVLL